MNDFDRATNTRGRTHAEYLPELRAQNAAWAAHYLPLLKARDAEKEARRAAGKAAMAKLEPEVRAAIVAAYGGSL